MAGESVVITHMGGGASTGQVVITRMQGGSGGIARVVITGMRGVVPGAFAISPGFPQTVDPFQIVQLNATVQTAGAAADDWLWEQIGGTPVILFGSGPSRTYQAPATMNGDTLTFRVTALSAGNDPIPADVAHQVRLHSGLWRLSSDRSRLIGVEYRTAPPVQLGTPPQPPGQPVTTSPTLVTSPTLTTQG